MTNDEIVVDTRFWEFVLELLKKLPDKAVSYLAVNFGAWEKEGIGCHAHVHVHLSLAGFQELRRNSKLAGILKGRGAVPKTYDTLDRAALRMRLIEEAIVHIRSTLVAIQKHLGMDSVSG